MATEKIDIRKKLRTYKFEYDLLQKIPCTQQENAAYEEILKNGGTLPETVHAYVYDSGITSTSEFYTIYEPELTEAEIREYLTYKQLNMLRTIKNCVVFFTVLTIIGMIAYFLIMMNTL